MPEAPPIPESRAVSRKRTRLSLVWIVPIVAALAGAWVAVTRFMDQGPTITIVFPSAEGLQAGKTEIHSNGVNVGTLESIRLSADHRTVVATARMAPKTESFLVEDTRFWVVTPRISGATVSGLGTLLSGPYVGMEIGKSKASRRDFVALDAPPVVTGDTPGRFFVLQSPTLGFLDVGVPLYFRQLQVGQVASYALDKDGKAVSLRVFVQAPYDQYVNPGTRFWLASGIDVSMEGDGLSVQTQSLLSILIGGIAFETPATAPLASPAAAETVFPLFDDRATAFKPVARDPQYYTVVFGESVHGLTVGSPVEFRGIRIGEVTAVRAQFDERLARFTVPVDIRVDPFSMGVRLVGGMVEENTGAAHRRLIDGLVARGLRAQLRSASLLTGSLMIAVDVFPNAAPALVDWGTDPPLFPSVPGQIEQIEASVVNIIKKIDKMPIDGIGENLKQALVGLEQTLASARGTFGGVDRTLDGVDRTLGAVDHLLQPDSLLGTSLGTTLDEVNRAARSLRVLADYLERHPESLLRGKPGEPKK